MDNSENIPVGIEAFEEENETAVSSGPGNQSDGGAASKTSTETTGKAPKSEGFFTRHAKKLNLVLVAALAVAVTVIIQQQGAIHSKSGMEMPKNHPDVSQMMSPGGRTNPEADASEIQKLRKQMSQRPQDPAPAKQLGKLFFDQGYYSDAASNFREAAKRDSRDIEIQMMLGASLYGMSDYTAAKQAWEQATNLDPTKAEPWYNLGFVYLMSEPPDYDNTRRVWNKVQELAPDSDMAQEVQRQLENIGKLPGKPAPSTSTQQGAR